MNMTGYFLSFILIFILGMGMGTGYYAGLWWTVRTLPEARHPALLSLGSFVVRMSLILSGFYLIVDSGWERLAVCLAGFLLARMVLTRWLGPGRKTLDSQGGVTNGNHS